MSVPSKVLGVSSWLKEEAGAMMLAMKGVRIQCFLSALFPLILTCSLRSLLNFKVRKISS